MDAKHRERVMMSSKSFENEIMCPSISMRSMPEATIRLEYLAKTLQQTLGPVRNTTRTKMDAKHRWMIVIEFCERNNVSINISEDHARGHNPPGASREDTPADSGPG